VREGTLRLALLDTPPLALVRRCWAGKDGSAVEDGELLIKTAREPRIQHIVALSLGGLAGLSGPAPAENSDHRPRAGETEEGEEPNEQVESMYGWRGEHCFPELAHQPVLDFAFCVTRFDSSLDERADTVGDWRARELE
jgi:hypothetical protein